MKKLKTLFTITLVIDILAIAPLFLMMFIPAMKEEMVYSQFSGMIENELAKEISDLFHFVFTFIAVAMVIAVAASIRIEVLEAAKTAAMLLFIVHLGWVLPDWVNLGNGWCTSANSSNATEYNSCDCVSIWVEKRRNLTNNLKRVLIN